MKNYVVLLIASFLFSCSSSSEQQKESLVANASRNSQQIKVVSWNIEWFGSSLEGPKDKDLQEKNVVKVLSYLNADIYALCEIVDTARFGNVVRQLPGDYQYFISNYASNAKNSNSASWQQAQKMAFIVRKNLLTNIEVNGYLRNNARLGYDLANGRYPYILSGNILMDGISQKLNVMILHAKSGADKESYKRRKEAAEILTTNIPTDFNNSPFLLVGDFNDETNGTISRGMSESPYAVFSNDDFHVLTSNITGDYKQSTIHYSTVIDHQIVNKDLYKYYILNSTSIFGNIQKVIKNYRNGNTSDHYPVVSIFNYRSNIQAKSKDTYTPVSVNKDQLFSIANTNVEDEIQLQAALDLQSVSFQVNDSNGKNYIQFSKRSLSNNRPFYLKCKELPSGNYSLIIRSGGKEQTVAITKQ